MIRVSREQLAERWALTYSQDGYQVRSEQVAGYDRPQPTAGIRPDLEAVKGNERVLVKIIESPETLDDDALRRALEVLEEARASGAKLHLIVAAECAKNIKERLDEWQIHADLVHVT